MLFLNSDGRVANSVDPDQVPFSVVSDLALHCLLRCVCERKLGASEIVLGCMLCV